MAEPPRKRKTRDDIGAVRREEQSRGGDHAIEGEKKRLENIVIDAANAPDQAQFEEFLYYRPRPTAWHEGV